MSIRKTKAGYWVVDFWDEFGKKRSRSFGKKPEGKKKAKEFDLEIQLKKSKGEPLPVNRSGGMYLDELCQIWINEKKAQGRKTKWLSEWVSVFNNKFAPDLCSVPCDMLGKADVMNVLAKHYTKSAQSTRNRYVGYIKSILQYGVDHELIKRNALALWQKGKEQSRNSILTLNDLKKIQRHSPDHLAWTIDVAWNIPVRPGPADLFSLRYDTNVNYAQKTIRVYHTKVNKWATIECSNDFIRKVFLSQQNNKSGFIIEYKGKPIADVGTALDRAVGDKGAKLPYTICLYDIRHLWITTMLNQGIEMSTIAYLAGTSVRMIMKNYYEPHSADRSKAALKLPKL